MKVHQKWGFGMAPIKRHIQDQRLAAVDQVLRIVDDQLAVGVDGPEAISLVKGLFNRTIRQDQWDWFTVWIQLGRPGRKRSQALVSGLAQLRRSGANDESSTADSARRQLTQHGLGQALRHFRTGPVDTSGQGLGYIYVLSTRSNPTLLKIGYTERPVEERVKEINSGTGVPEPYGVRAVWTVHHARRLESQVHQRLSEHRVRADREFFSMDFRDAFSIIREIVYQSRAER